MNAVRISVFSVVLILVSTQLQGQVTLPSGLAPGTQYEIIAFSQGLLLTPGTSSNISYYNNYATATVNSDPTLASLGVSWNAVVSTPTVNANANAVKDGSINVYNTHGQLVADGSDPLYSGGGLLNYIYGSNGDGPVANIIWTGSNPDGSGVPGLQLGSGDAVYGTDEVLTAEWMDDGIFTAGAGGLIYELSNPITVPVPEPATMTLLGTALLGLGLVYPGIRVIRVRLACSSLGV